MLGNCERTARRWGPGQRVEGSRMSLSLSLRVEVSKHEVLYTPTVRLRGLTFFGVWAKRPDYMRLLGYFEP